MIPFCIAIAHIVENVSDQRGRPCRGSWSYFAECSKRSRLGFIDPFTFGYQGCKLALKEVCLCFELPGLFNVAEHRTRLIPQPAMGRYCCKDRIRRDRWRTALKHGHDVTT
jgi:hypothetical protein